MLPNWVWVVRIEKTIAFIGPSFAWPLIGNSLEIGKDIKTGFLRLRAKYGDVFTLFLGPTRTVVIADYKIAQEVANMREFSDRVNLPGLAYIRGGMIDAGDGKVTTPGVMFSSGHVWAEQRRFSLHTLKDLGFGKSSMENSVLEEVAEFSEHVSVKSKGQPIDIQGDLSVAVLNSLWRILSSERLNYNDKKLKHLVSMISLAFKEIPKPSTFFVHQFEILAKLSYHFNILTYSKAMSSVIELAGTIVDSHQESFQDEAPRDFTDLYLKEIKNRSERNDGSSFVGSTGYQNLCNTLMDFFVAGSETTSNTLNFAFLYMIGYPEVRKRVQRELDAVTCRSRLPTLQDRSKTPYTEAVIHEIQRITSVSPVGVPHVSSKDVVIGHGRYFIPKGSMIFFLIEHMMKDPEVFPEPNVFDPSRYLDKNGQFVPHLQVLPFGIGKRRCLGESLARMSLYLFFTGILSRFDLEKCDDELDFEPQTGITLSPKPYKLRFVSRD